MSEKAMVGIITKEEFEKLLKGEMSQEDLIAKACSRIDDDKDLKDLLDSIIGEEPSISEEKHEVIKKADAVVELSEKLSGSALEGLEFTSIAAAKLALRDLTRVTSLKKALNLASPAESIALLAFLYDMLGCQNLEQVRFVLATTLHMLSTEFAVEIEKGAKEFITKMQSDRNKQVVPKEENKEEFDPFKAAVESVLKGFNK